MIYNVENIRVAEPADPYDKPFQSSLGFYQPYCGPTKAHNVTTACGYVPLLGSIAGVARVAGAIFALIKNRVSQTEHLDVSAVKQLRFQLLRGLVETMSLGWLLIIPDIIVSVLRAQEESKLAKTAQEKYAEQATMPAKSTSKVDPNLRKTPIAELKKGRINPFLIPLGKRSVDDQVKEIMDYIQKFIPCLGEKNQKIAITFSTNNDQAENIYQGYDTGEYSIQGCGQAKVFSEIAKQIKEKKLQNNVHILPIPTSLHPDGKVVSELEQVKKAMENIARHLSAGWTVLGLQNDVIRPGLPFAIGQGIEGLAWQYTEQEKYAGNAMRVLLEGNVPADLNKD